MYYGEHTYSASIGIDFSILLNVQLSTVSDILENTQDLLLFNGHFESERGTRFVSAKVSASLMFKSLIN